MSEVFLKMVNLSITASWLILAVVIARLLLKRGPKWICCALWALVALRLVCPFSFESSLSLIPNNETIPHNIAMSANPAIDSGIPVVNDIINPVISNSFTPEPLTSANPLQIVIPALSVVWLAGVIGLLLYALVSYIRLKKSVAASVSIRDGVMACDDVRSPFILGIFKPVIYVPSAMNGETLDHVITHETAHIKRRDHWWKPFGFLLLAVYWFNPLCWLAYVLLCRDIEMACDEKVIRDMDNDGKATYAQALLDCSFPRKRIAACPLAFGEVGVKERVKSVLNYKKPTFWVVTVAVIACIAVAVCFLTNPKGKDGVPVKVDEWDRVRVMAPAYAPYLLELSSEEVEALKSGVYSSAWTLQVQETVPDGESYSVFIYNNGNPVWFISRPDYVTEVVEKGETRWYAIDPKLDEVIADLANPEVIPTEELIFCEPENISAEGVWEQLQ